MSCSGKMCRLVLCCNLYIVQLSLYSKRDRDDSGAAAIFTSASRDELGKEKKITLTFLYQSCKCIWPLRLSGKKRRWYRQSRVSCFHDGAFIQQDSEQDTQQKRQNKTTLHKLYQKMNFFRFFWIWIMRNVLVLWKLSQRGHLKLSFSQGVCVLSKLGLISYPANQHMTLTHKHTLCWHQNWSYLSDKLGSLIWKCYPFIILVLR